MGEYLSTIVTVLLSAGGATALLSFVKAVNTLRSGARARERDIRQDALQETRSALADARFWERVAGRYAHQLVEHGHTPDPEDPEPPSARPEPSRPARARRSRPGQA